MICFSQYRNDTWSVCPAGYFLNGFGTYGVHYLHNIQHGHCCKPSNHPDGYGLCYTEDVGDSFEKEGWTNCSKLGYYITGVYRGSGYWLKNIDKFRCCQMAAGNEITSKILYDVLTTEFKKKIHFPDCQRERHSQSAVVVQ